MRKLTAAQRNKRRERCEEMLRKLETDQVAANKFSGQTEKIFKATGPMRGGSTQNVRAWAPKGANKEILRRRHFLQGRQAGGIPQSTAWRRWG